MSTTPSPDPSAVPSSGGPPGPSPDPSPAAPPAAAARPCCGSGGSCGGGGGAGGEPPRPGRFRAAGPRGRHLRAHVLIAGWLVLALLSAAATAAGLSAGRWLTIHFFLLGAVTTAIVVWSEHFTVALLHSRPPDPRWSDVRLLGLTLAVPVLLAGFHGGWPVLSGLGATGILAVVVAHLVVLTRLGRGALGGRLAPIARYYRAAAVALIAGGVLGGLRATGLAAGSHAAGITLAHLHLNLLGWVGLPVLGTLFMLWPTVLGVPMEERTALTARRALWPLGAGLAVAAGGLLAGARWPAAAGVAVFAAGTAMATVLFVRTAVRRAPRSGAAWMLAASTGWLLAALGADLVLMATRPPKALLGALEPLLPVLLAGFVGQVLLGALTYLLPVVLSRGPRQRAALAAVLDHGWRTRLVLLNAGVLLVALPLPGAFTAAGAALAGGAGAVFCALTALVLLHRPDAEAAPPAPGPARTESGGGAGAGGAGAARPPGGSRRAPLIGTGAGVLLTVLAVLIAGTGAGTGDGTGTTAAAQDGTGAVATGERTVAVTLTGMRVEPDRIEVAPGTALRLEVTNDDGHPHDLRIEDGPATPMLGWRESATLDLGPVTADLDGWCTVPGHRAAGMTMTITVTGGEPGEAGGHGATAPADAADPAEPAAPDLAADPSPGWEPLPAALPAAPDGRLHRVELRAVEADVEVAPGVTQRMWTFGGTAPGPTLRGSVGDTFEITLVNDAEMGHSIDFHAGALAPDEPMRTIAPGERLVYRFTAERAGAWLYHCGTPPMLQHIANGMYGAVVVDPPGLPAVDREYLLVASELYLGEVGSEEQVARMRAGRPDLRAFNGTAAQYAKAPLAAAAGDRARFWVVNAGPGGTVAFHVVGTVFDTVFKEGGYLLRPADPGGAQVLDLAAAQGGFVETVFPEAGHYPFVDHDMRHAESGTHGTVRVVP